VIGGMGGVVGGSDDKDSLANRLFFNGVTLSGGQGGDPEQQKNE